MHAFKKILLAAALVGVGACGSDGATAPNLDNELDPTVIEQRLDDLSQINQHPALATLIELGNSGPALTQVSKTFDRAAGIVSRTKRLAASGGTHRSISVRKPSATVGSVVPADIRGTTYVWDAAEGWVASDATGAPSDGIRFIIPTLDIEGQPTGVELGRLDVHDLGTATSDRMTATLVSGGKTLLTIDIRAVETETSYDEDQTVMVTDGTRRVNLVYSDTETWTGEEERDVETYELTSNVGLGYRSSYIWGDLRSSDVNWDQFTVGNATIRFSWKSELDAETGSYVESDDADITVNGRLYARELYDPATGEYTYEDAQGEPLGMDEVEQLYSVYGTGEWLFEAVYWPVNAVQWWTNSVAGTVIY